MATGIAGPPLGFLGGGVSLEEWIWEMVVGIVVETTSSSSSSSYYVHKCLAIVSQWETLEGFGGFAGLHEIVGEDDLLCSGESVVACALSWSCTVW